MLSSFYQISNPKNPVVAFLGYCWWSLFVFQDIVDSQGCLKTKSCWPHTPLSRTFLSAVLFFLENIVFCKGILQNIILLFKCMLLFILTVTDRGGKISCLWTESPTSFNLLNQEPWKLQRDEVWTLYKEGFWAQRRSRDARGRGIGDNRVKISRLSGLRTTSGGGTNDNQDARKVNIWMPIPA